MQSEYDEVLLFSNLLCFLPFTMHFLFVWLEFRMALPDHAIDLLFCLPLPILQPFVVCLKFNILRTSKIPLI